MLRRPVPFGTEPWDGRVRDTNEGVPRSGVEPFQSEGGTSTVAEQPFDTWAVPTLDADGRIDAESSFEGASPLRTVSG